MKRKLIRLTENAVSNCRLARASLKEINPTHYLLWVNIYSKSGNKWLIHSFYPKESEKTSSPSLDNLRMWVNYYTALTLATLEAKSLA